ERRSAVLRPLKLVIDSYPESQVEWMEAVNNPENPAAGTRKVPFARELWIEQDDFRDPAPPKYFRLSPGAEVRLRYAYVITCTGAERDAAGNVVAVHATHDPATRGGEAARKIKGTIHWVSATHAIEAEIRLYDTLFSSAKPDDAEDWKASINPASLETLTGCRVEPALADVAAPARFQFERTGYFAVDSRDARPGRPVFNRTVGLRDTWAKIESASAR
ncbi:MAG: glutamine--tRNA ligase, partial [Myxococcales bacterium]